MWGLGREPAATRVRLETLRGYIEYYNMVYRAAKNAQNLFQTAKWRITFVYGPRSDAISICYTQRNGKKYENYNKFAEFENVILKNLKLTTMN